MNQTIEHLPELAELGIQVAHGALARAGSLHPLELMAEKVIPEAGISESCARPVRRSVFAATLIVIAALLVLLFVM